MTKCFGGIDLGGTFIKAGLLSPDGIPRAKFRIPTQADCGVAAVAENLRRAGRMLVGAAQREGMRLQAIGVGSPGTIIHPQGIVTGATPNIPGWIGANIGKLFADFDIKVTGDNDANCMGLAEARFGAGRGTSFGFYLTLGTGVGGAIIINGELLRGATFAAGEFGHMVLKYDGKLCKTGRRGCLEGYVNAAALVESAIAQVRKDKNSSLRKQIENLAPEDIFSAFRKGDKAAIAAITENAAMIGAAIGSVVNLLNPEIVVIGGGMSSGGARYIGLIRQHAKSFAFESATVRLKIERARLGNEAGWIGAACLNIL